MAALEYALPDVHHRPGRPRGFARSRQFLLRSAFHDSQAARQMSAAAKRICVLSAVLLAALLWVLPSRAQTSLDDAYHVITSKIFVDLTHAFGPDTPVWSGFGQARMSPAIDPKTHATLYDREGRFSRHFLRNGWAIWHPRRSARAFCERRDHDGQNSARGDDFAARGF